MFEEMEEFLQIITKFTLKSKTLSFSISSSRPTFAYFQSNAAELGLGARGLAGSRAYFYKTLQLNLQKHNDNNNTFYIQGG